MVEEEKTGMENALRAKPREAPVQKKINELQTAYGEAILELEVRKNLAVLPSWKRDDPADTGGDGARGLADTQTSPRFRPWAQSLPPSVTSRAGRRV